MIKKLTLLAILVINFQFGFSQGSNSKLIKADKLYIKLAYADAGEAYEAYLKKTPKDFYASRQAALCYTKINDQNKAIDFWPAVIENSQATDADKLAYAKCLLANYRNEDAKKVLATLKNSLDKTVANWCKAFENSYVFYEDSSLCKIVEVKGINTTKPEFAPKFFKSEMIYITETKKSGPISISSAWSNEKFYKFFFAQKQDSLNFTKPKIYNNHIQSKKVNGPLCFTPDDSTMYFTKSASKSDMKKAKVQGSGIKLQIFYTRMNSFGDAHPEILPFLYNSTDYDCMHPSISKDGKRLYFASDMPGTLGGKDIFVCEWDKGAWGTPKNLGPEVNTIGNEVFPFISNEGVLFFTSDSRPGLGGLDVFFADPNKTTGMFYEAENVGATINSQFDDFGIFVKTGGKTGYLSSNRKNGYRDDDIYYFVNNKPKAFDLKLKFVDSLSLEDVSASFTVSALSETYNEKLDAGKTFAFRVKPGKEINLNAISDNYRLKTLNQKIEVTDTLVKVLLASKSQKAIKGKILDKETNLPIAGVKVAIYDEFGNKFLDVVTDTTGNYIASNLPLDKALFIGSEKRPDYFSNTEKFFIKKDSDLVKNIYTQKIVVGKAIKVENIYFDKGKFNIRADAAKELDKLVQLMKDNPDIIIELSSHTDCQGVASANLALSDKRAKSSAAYLISKGISKTRVKGKGYGESKLLNNCACEGKVESKCNEDEMAVNRRSEFKVTGFVAKAAEAKPKKGKK